MNRRSFLTTSAAWTAAPAPAATPANSHQAWAALLRKLAQPVLRSLANGTLLADMPVEAPAGNTADRRQFTHLEAAGRLLSGAAPYLATREGSDLATLARSGLEQAVDSRSPDFLNFNRGRQPLVDAAFLALALLRAPDALWTPLSPAAKTNLLTALRSTRTIDPPFNNWILFSATIEAFFAAAGQDWDRVRVDYALLQLEQWYKGDSLYGDGPELHFDYYNSFVIHPMLLAVSQATGHNLSTFLQRSQRYAVILERLIAPDGSFPATGRSLAYRCGAFHLLADLALRQALPASLPPAQVRSALNAVIGRTLTSSGTFDSGGWLQIGLCGHQPTLAEPYISTGSLYLCAAAFLPLGLPPDHNFWAAPALPITSQRVWSAAATPVIDHAL